MKYLLFNILLSFLIIDITSASLLAQKAKPTSSTAQSRKESTSKPSNNERVAQLGDSTKQAVVEDIVLETQIKNLFITAWHQHDMMNKSTLMEQSSMDSVFTSFNTSLVQLVLQRESGLREHITELKKANESLYHSFVDFQTKEANRAAVEKADREALVKKNDKLQQESVELRKKLDKLQATKGRH